MFRYYSSKTPTFNYVFGGSIVYDVSSESIHKRNTFMYTKQQKAAIIKRLQDDRKACIALLRNQSSDIEQDVQRKMLRRLNLVGYTLRSIKIKHVMDLERQQRHTAQTLIAAIKNMKREQEQQQQSRVLPRHQ